MGHSIEDVKKGVGANVHPPGEDDKVGPTVNDTSGDFCVVMLAGRAGNAVQESLEGADACRDRRGVDGGAGETIGV